MFSLLSVRSNNSSRNWNQWKRNSKLFFDELINFYYLRETYSSFFRYFQSHRPTTFSMTIFSTLHDPSHHLKWFNPRFSPAVQRRSAVNSSSSIGSTRARNEPQNYDIVSSIVSLFASCVSDSNSPAASNLPTLTMQLGKYYEHESRLSIGFQVIERFVVRLPTRLLLG